MKTHFDPMLRRQVMHEHNLEDVSGIYSVAAGNLGSLDAGAGTEEDPIIPPESNKSGFWIITVAGYIDLDGASTFFDAGDFLTFDLNTETYARIDNKILDDNLDISSNFTNGLLSNPALSTQKAVNERLDIYVPPAASKAGAISFWDGSKRINADPDEIKWVVADKQLVLGDNSSIKVGDHTISRDSVTYLKFSNSIWAGGGLLVSTNADIFGDIRSRGNFTLLNKAGNEWLSFAARDTSGSEAAFILNNVKSLNIQGHIFSYFDSQRLALSSSLRLPRVNITSYIDMDDNCYISVGTTKMLQFYNGGISFRNKANTAQLPFATRNISGSEALLDLTGIGKIVVASQPPATAGATGTAGQFTWDADYIYICVATDIWKRVAIATW